LIAFIKLIDADLG